MYFNRLLGNGWSDLDDFFGSPPGNFDSNKKGKKSALQHQILHYAYSEFQPILACFGLLGQTPVSSGVCLDLTFQGILVPAHRPRVQGHSVKQFSWALNFTKNRFKKVRLAVPRNMKIFLQMLHKSSSSLQGCIKCAQQRRGFIDSKGSHQQRRPLTYAKPSYHNSI